MATPERAPLSRQRIAEAALALGDVEGLDGLSMRKVGASLGVEAMSLYNHVSNKDDLLDAVLDSLYAEVQLPVDVPAQDWETAIRVGLRSFHDVLVRHPAALELFASRPAKSEVALQVLLWAYSRFQSVGLDVAQSVHALHFGVSFVMGHVANELGTMAVVADGDGIDLSKIENPDIVAMVTERRTLTGEQMFDVGMEAVVAGLRAAFNLP